MARWLLILALAGPLAAQSESTLLEGAGTPGNADVSPGATEVLALAFQLARTTAAEDAVFTGLRLHNAGTAADCLRAQLWLDSDGNGAFDAMSDALLGQAGGAFPVTITLPEPLLIPNGQARALFVTLDVSPNAAPASTMQLRVQPGDVSVSAYGVSGSAVTGGTLTVVGNTAPRLALLSQPAGAWADQPFTNQPVLELLDGAGQRVAIDNTTVVTAAIAPGTGTAGATLGPAASLTATAANGVVTFSGLKVSTAGSGFALYFTAANFAGALTASFEVGAVTLALHVAQQPGGAKAGKPFETQPRIEFRDAGGTVASVNYTVTAALAAGPGNLTGNTQATAANGAATFSNLAVDQPGTYRLQFTAPGATGTQSRQFSVGSSTKGTTNHEEKSGWFGCAVSEPIGGLVALALMLALVAGRRSMFPASLNSTDTRHADRV